MELAGTGWDIAAMVYTALGASLLAALGYGLSLIRKKWLEEFKTTWWAGAVTRLTYAVENAFAAAHAEIKLGVDKARDPASPGGTALTKEERDMIFDAVWERLKDQYGGMDGIKEALQIVVGGDVSKFINDRISTLLADAEDPK